MNKTVSLQVLFCLLGVNAASKKSLDSEAAPQEKKAILAIEIVDPSQKTDGKNAKRTIESSLGYGYQNGHSQPKYQVYKYSQHDIPPYKGDNVLQSGIKGSGKVL